MNGFLIYPTNYKSITNESDDHDTNCVYMLLM